MKSKQWLLAVLVCSLLAACGGPKQDAEGGSPESADPMPATQSKTPEAVESTEIAPGLSMRILHAGSGETAQTGQLAVVHYTGWLYDPEAEDHRGQKFDSSVDRGQPFEFPLGAGSVIQGWDQGVVGMQIGEVRELTIAPELAYGERGAGEVIPPGATLVFEVELIELR